MKDKKHIDRLFQERFKDFEATPDASVWEAIEDSLEHKKKKKKRRVIPIWWRVGGIAAGLLLLFTIGNFVFNPNIDATNNNVVNTEENGALIDSTIHSEATIKTQKDKLEVIASENAVLENNNKEHEEDAEVFKDSKSDLSNQFVNSKKENSTQSTPSIYNNAHIAATTKPNKEGKSAITVKNRVLSSNPILENIASQEQPESGTNTNTNNSIDGAKADALIKETQKNTSGTVVSIDTKKEDTLINASEETLNKEIGEEEKPSILDEINSTEDEEDKVADLEPSRNKWNVMPNVAPVYFNTLGNGSSIHSQFKNNDKSGQINMTYGLTASYNVSDKLSIRSGVNKVKVGYNTNDVLIYQGIETAVTGAATGRSLETINYNNNAESITVVTSANLPYAQVPDVINSAINASLDQSLGFIEVPLELSYTVSDKKLGVSVIGGMSALFLSNNEVYSTLNGDRTLLGEANNIRNTSFTTNVGLGLGYKISDKIDINLEPVFKYHMNTFKSKSGDFKPYTIGVYTGFSFKF